MIRLIAVAVLIVGLTGCQGWFPRRQIAPHEQPYGYAQQGPPTGQAPGGGYYGGPDAQNDQPSYWNDPSRDDGSAHGRGDRSTEIDELQARLARLQAMKDDSRRRGARMEDSTADRDSDRRSADDPSFDELRRLDREIADLEAEQSRIDTRLRDLRAQRERMVTRYGREGNQTPRRRRDDDRTPPGDDLNDPDYRARIESELDNGRSDRGGRSR